MSQGKSYLRLFLFIACIVVSLAAMINVFADNDEVLAQAKAIACAPKVACDHARTERSPFAQTFDFDPRRARSVCGARERRFFRGVRLREEVGRGFATPV